MGKTVIGKTRRRTVTRSGRHQRRRDHRRAASVALGLVVLAAAGTVATAPSSPAATVAHRDIMLTEAGAAAAPTFDQSLQYLLDDMLKTGTKTLPQLLAPNASETLGELLGESSNGTTTVDTALHIGSLLDLLGLNNITVNQVMDALNLNTTKTVDQILQQMQLANVDLDQILTPLGVPSTQTLYGLADRFSVLNMTLGEIMQKIGPISNPDTQTVQAALQSIGMGGFYTAWFVPGKGAPSALGANLYTLCSGVDGTVEDALNCITTQYGNADSTHPNVKLSSNETVGYLLTHIYQLQPGTQNANFNAPIGDYTLGQGLGFNSTTTVQQFVDKLMVNMNVTAGQFGGGVSATTGQPVGNPVVTTITGDPYRGQTTGLPFDYCTSSSSCDSTNTTLMGSNVTVVTAPSDDPGQSTPVALGSQTWGSVLTWLNVPPTESLAQLIDGLWVNNTQLGDYTVGNMLQGLVVDQAALGSTGEVSDSTTVQDFLTAIGFNNMTLDQFLGLS